MYRYYSLLCIFIALLFTMCGESSTKKTAPPPDPPRIVNIINFIRAMEPRYGGVFTEDVLYETVVNQVNQLNEWKLPATFLLQYDALIIPRYQDLLKNQLFPGSEVGGWWEITQPHVEAAGLQWRGRFPWDWHANIGFSVGYTPKEREILVDVYMEKFKSVFGSYPSSVASWFIDAHTLAYMHDKYNIVASANCKDQLGTDGYTLWGGYWNQAYYPSRKNAYMPAQNEDAQIPVPIFRMLGSDPIYQYEYGLGGSVQRVISLEPVYRRAGGDRRWVEWFFRSMFKDPALNFNYVQAGQENMFGWEAMRRGLEIQIPLLDTLRQQGIIRVETLETSGKWFREQFPVTPPTALSALTDIRDEGRQTVWFNSRFYRVNLLWTENAFRFRDIHLFDERLESNYLTKPTESNQAIYTTLPLVDGFRWSTPQDLAGLRFKQVGNDGQISELLVGNPVVTTPKENVLQVECTFETGEIVRMTFYEDYIEFFSNARRNLKWILELDVAPGKTLPFTTIEKQRINAELDGFRYGVTSKGAHFEKLGNTFRIIPSGNRFTLIMKQSS
jgi:hypothetical protein